jgi:mannose-6-phosphate isomerase-like protein (cupin superfamily)
MLVDMHVTSLSELPTSAFSRELIGDEHGGVDLSIIFVDAAPGRGPSLHRHDYAEVFIVQEGEATVVVDDETRVLRPGDIAVIPAGAWHGFTNTGDVPLKQIDLHLNGRFATEWREGRDD